MAELKVKLMGLVKKLEDNVELLGGGLGVAQPLLYDQSKYGYDVIENAKYKISHWKFVNPIDVLKLEFSPEHKERFGDPIATGIVATVVAWILRELGVGTVHPIAERVLSLVQKGGLAYSIGVAGSGFVWLPSAMSSSPSPERRGREVAPYIYGR